MKDKELFGNKVKLENKPCPLGCPPNDKILFSGFDRLHNLPGKYWVVRCENCGIIRTNPRPTLDTISFYYPNNYSPYHGTKVKEMGIKKYNFKFWSKLLQRIFKFNTMCLPILTPGKMLEIGCASGAFMKKMADKGWKVWGVELSPFASSNAIALGFPVHTGPLETAFYPQQIFDLVVGWMVLEHLYDPILGLKKIYEWTKPGGWLILSVPNTGCYEFHFFKNYWYALQLPTHLFHFNKRTIRKILNFSGWDVLKIYHQRVLYNLIPSIGYVLSDLIGEYSFIKNLIKFSENPGKLNYFLYPLAYFLASFGQTGRMTIWARKQGADR